MLDGSSLTLFLLASWVLLITPGPAVLYIVARSVEQGQVAGVVSTLGVGAGTLVHVAAATLSLSALLLSSALAFSVVKYAGAAYLVYLGVRMLRAGEAPAPAGSGQHKRLRRLFYDGAVGKRAEPEDRAVLFRLPAPVRRHLARLGGAAGADTRCHLRAHGHPQRRSVGPAGRIGRRLVETQGTSSAATALLRGQHAYCPGRGDRGVRLGRQQVNGQAKLIVKAPPVALWGLAAGRAKTPCDYTRIS